MSKLSSIPPADIDQPPLAPPPTVFEFSLTKSRRRSVKQNPNTTAASPPPPSMEGFGLRLINNCVPPGRERVPPKIFDPSSPQPTKRRRGRPSTKRFPNCMRGDSQIQVEPCTISPVPASPMSTPSNQSNDDRPIHPARDHSGLQGVGSVPVPSIHQAIGSTTYMKVENVTINENEHRKEGVMSGAHMERHQGLDMNFSYGVEAALTNIVFPAVGGQNGSSAGETGIYNVNHGFKDLLQSIVESQPATRIIESDIYNVNSSYADTLKSIYEKHGDIAKDCTLQSPYLRTSFLEAICKEVQELKSKKLSELDCSLLSSSYLVVNDGETMKFNVNWFRERLDEIRTAIGSFVESQKIAEKMKQLEDTKRDLKLKKIELEKLVSDVEGMESQLTLETQVVEDMNRSSRDLECKFKHFLDMNLMDGVL